MQILQVDRRMHQFAAATHQIPLQYSCLSQEKHDVSFQLCIHTSRKEIISMQLPYTVNNLWTIKNLIVRQELLLGCFWQSCWEFKEHRQVVTSHHTITILKTTITIINTHSCITGHFGGGVIRSNSVSFAYCCC